MGQNDDRIRDDAGALLNQSSHLREASVKSDGVAKWRAQSPTP